MPVVPADKLLRRPESFALLSKLGEPASTWKYFMAFMETPRPSHKLGKIHAKLKEIADLLEVEFETDEAENIVLRKPATKGLEGAPGIVIQGHMDMVCSKNDNIEFDWDNDPVNASIKEYPEKSEYEGDSNLWLKAMDTTLGADNGLGVAAGIALLEEAGLEHPMLEILITANEETDMSGAENLSTSILKGRICLNIDSEEEKAVCIGCAGGFERTLHLPVVRAAAPDLVYKRVHLLGCAGGHTGVQIHEGRCNALQSLAQILRTAATAAPSAQLAEFKSGTAINALPREANAIVGVSKEELEKFEAAVNEEFAKQKQTYRSTDGDMTIKVAEAEAQPACDVSSTQKSLALLCSIPHGVIRMSPVVEGLVETSQSLSIAELKEGEMFAHVFPRSSSLAGSEQASLGLKSLALLAGATVSEEFNGFCGWDPNEMSKALAVVKKVHNSAIGTDPKVYAVHAGLECGLLMNQYPDLDCVSFGPWITGAHSPDERAFLPSVPRFWNLLKGTVEEFASQAKA